jgi:flavin reductase (DIM6/NTAB) family NADH-FMN oxidoreductase RutF
LAVVYIGTKTGRAEDKTAAVGWEVKKASQVNALYSTAFALVYQCKLIDFKTLGFHTIFFGEVVEVDAKREILNESGTPMFAKLDPLILSGFESSCFKFGEVVGRARELYKKIGP